WWSRTSFVEVIPLSSLRMLQLKLLHPEHLIADGVIISFSNWLATGTGRRGFSAGRPLWVAGSTDRRNTFCELLSWGLKEQGLSRPFIELPCDRAELGLAIQRQIDATRKILAQQSVGVFV